MNKLNRKLVAGTCCMCELDLVSTAHHCCHLIICLFCFPIQTKSGCLVTGKTNKKKV